MPRQLMPKQDPGVRCRNFDEVALGYSREQATAEASRCLTCARARCVQGCPVGVDIPGFVAEIKRGDLARAACIVRDKNILAAVCGRVCPQESQCERACALGKKSEPLAIGALERFVADWAALQPRAGCALRSRLPFRAAIVGSGPSGLACAAELATGGCSVTIFEALHEVGGVLQYGIPQFRLPKEIVDREVEYVRQLGVQIETNVLVGRTVTLDELFRNGFDTVFIGTGAGLPSFLQIPGENLCGVYSANEFLTRVNLMKAYRFPEFDTPVHAGRSVAVIGGGNVAMDAARTALRLGADRVSVVYRRSRAELPARREEIENAEEEGVTMRLLTSPRRITGSSLGEVAALECIGMELGDPDASGRRRPVPIPGAVLDLPVDTVIVAIGQGPSPILLRSTGGLALNERGYIQANQTTLETSIAGVFAGGDIVTGAATVIAAMGAGKLAAQHMLEYCRSLHSGSTAARGA